MYEPIDTGYLPSLLMVLQVFSTYNLGTAIWLSIQAVPLLISPSLITAVLSPELHQITSLFPIHLNTPAAG